MGLWHGVQHYQFMKISEESDTELYITSWPDVLKDNYEYRYDWSYIVSWVGVGMTLLSSILFALAALCIKNDRETEDAMNLQYLMPGILPHSTMRVDHTIRIQKRMPDLCT